MRASNVASTTAPALWQTPSACEVPHELQKAGGEGVSAPFPQGIKGPDYKHLKVPQRVRGRPADPAFARTYGPAKRANSKPDSQVSGTGMSEVRGGSALDLTECSFSDAGNNTCR